MHDPEVIMIIFTTAAAAASLGYFIAQRRVFVLQRHAASDLESCIRDKDHQISEIARKLSRSDEELTSAKYDISRHIYDVDRLKNLLEISRLPPNNTKLIEYLYNMYNKSIDDIEKMELFRISIAESIRFAKEQAEYRLTKEGRQRFVEYYESLLRVDDSLALRCEKLCNALPPLASAIEKVKAGDLSVGSEDDLFDTANKVLEELANEDDIDKVWSDANRRRNTEFKVILKLRERNDQIDRRERERVRIEAEVNFKRYGRRPLTPKEQFDRLKSYGWRDSYSMTSTEP